MTGSCHSAVCCTLFHSDALAGMEKSRMCREATTGSGLGRSALSPRAGGTGRQHLELSGPLCCHRTVADGHGAVTSPGLQRGSRDLPSLLPALLPALTAADCAVGQGSFEATLPTLSPLTDSPQGRIQTLILPASISV